MKHKLFPAKKNSFILLGIALFLLSLLTNSCYNDKEEILYPQSVCDTANITYSRSVVPVLSANCTSCHGGNTPSAGISLDNYNGIKTVADNGKLLGAVSHTAGFSPMPKNGAKMSSCNITKIKKWIDAGALNN
jgi:cytochrome c5